MALISIRNPYKSIPGLGGTKHAQDDLYLNVSAMVLEAAQNMVFVPKSKLVDLMHLKSQ